MFILTLVLIQVASSESYPISRGNCTVNINGYTYSLAEMANARPADTYSDTENDWDYYVSICNSLTKEEIGGASTLSLDGVLVARCQHWDPSSCIALSSLTSFDWRFYEPRAPNTGVTYYSYGQPYLDPESPYEVPYTFDIEVNVICDESATGQNPASFTYDISNNLITLKMDIVSASGCPKKGDVPTPTPIPWPPKCRYTDRYTESPTYGVDLELSSLNGGPYGIEVPVQVGEQEQIMFFQPCERSECPPGFSCQDQGMSSVWLCTKDEKVCQSYGVVDAQTTEISLSNPFDETSGLVIKFAGNGSTRNTAFYLNCNNFWPDGHVKFSSVTSLDNTLSVYGTAKDVCPKTIPEPAPPGNKCSVWQTITQGETVHMELADFNNGTSGWTTELTLEGTPKYTTLIYQPCGGIACPDDTFCDGDEDATVWLCRSETGVAPDRECIGYGLYDMDLSWSLKNPDDPSQGVVTLYKGSRGRSAAINYVCNEAAEEIRISQEGTLSDNTFSIVVESAKACPTREPTPTPSPKPSPTPEPTYKPTPTMRPTPTMGPTPTPGPEPTPSPANESLPIGAIFMLALLGIFILYVMIGVFVTMGRTGSPQFPNANFWGEVGESLCYVLCCGRCSRRRREETTEGRVKAFMQPLTD